MNSHEKDSIDKVSSIITMKQMQGHNFSDVPKQPIKKSKKHVYFNEPNEQLQLNSPIVINQQLYRIQSHNIKRINPSKHHNVVLKSIDKFVQKTQNFERQIINSFNIRSTINNSKSKNKKPFQNSNQFLEFFQQTMLQLKQLLKDVTSLVDKVKEMLADGTEQLSKFQKNLKTSASYGKIQQGINSKINSLQEYNVKVPFTTNNNSSIHIETPLLTPRVQESEQQIGKIIKNHKKKLNLSINKSSQRHERISYSCRKDTVKYNGVNFDDISQTTAKMRKLLDLL